MTRKELIIINQSIHFSCGRTGNELEKREASLKTLWASGRGANPGGPRSPSLLDTLIDLISDGPASIF